MILNILREMVLLQSVESLRNLLTICCSFGGIVSLLTILCNLAVGFGVNKNAFLSIVIFVRARWHFYRGRSHRTSILLILYFNFHTLWALVPFDLWLHLLFAGISQGILHCRDDWLDWWGASGNQHSSQLLIINLASKFITLNKEL